MSQNNTHVALVKASSQVFFGGNACVCHLLLLGRILFTKRLRRQKEYVIIGAYMLFDALYGQTFLLKGIYHLTEHFFGNGTLQQHIHPSECLAHIDALLLTFVIPGSGIMTLSTAFDRLLAVAYPFFYARLGIAYGLSLVFASYALSMPGLVYGAFYAHSGFPEGYLVPETCGLNDWLPASLSSGIQILRGSATTVGALLYIPVGFKIYNVKKMTSTPESTPGHLRKITLTIVLVASTDVLLVALPDFLHLFESMAFLRPLMLILIWSKGTADVIIFLVLHPELRGCSTKRKPSRMSHFTPVVPIQSTIRARLGTF